MSLKSCYTIMQIVDILLQTSAHIIAIMDVSFKIFGVEVVCPLAHQCSSCEN